MKVRWMASLIVVLALCTGSVFALDYGQVPPTVKLSAKKGGRVDGTPWSSEEIRGKVYTLMYVDPDAKDMNVPVEKALKAENFPKDRYGSIAVINMEATWKPNVIINAILKGKQKDYPDTIYVKDMDYYVDKAWDLKKNGSYAVLSFDQDGKLIFEKDGQMNQSDIQTLIAAIKKALNTAPEEQPAPAEPEPQQETTQEPGV